MTDHYDRSQNAELQAGVDKIMEVYGAIPEDPSLHQKGYSETEKKYENNPPIQVLYVEGGDKVNVFLSPYFDHKNLDHLVKDKNNLKRTDATRVWTVPLEILKERIHEVDTIDTVSRELGGTFEGGISHRKKLEAATPDHKRSR